MLKLDDVLVVHLLEELSLSLEQLYALLVEVLALDHLPA